MKALFIVLVSAFSMTSWAQEPFEKDGKWGLSKNGDANDSIIFRADYDKIEKLVSNQGAFYIGLKGEGWYPMTPNKLLNQQSYEEITIPLFDNSIAVAQRDGYIDIVELKEMNFLIRNVNATNVVDIKLFQIPKDYILTQKEKSYGLISRETKKEILKVKYSSILPDAESPQNAWLFAREEGKTSVFDKKGALVFEIKSLEQIVSMVQEVANPTLFITLSAEGAYGMYNKANKWLVPAVYMNVLPFDGTDEIVVVKGKKGVGLFFNGKQLLEPVYITIDKKNERGYLAVVVNKKGRFLLSPEGSLTLIKE
jgi:hypothetical protein